MIKSKFFLFPNFNPTKDKSGNPYLKLLSSALENHGVIKNRLIAKLGFTSIFFNLDADIFILNWTETIPFKPFGLVQVFFFTFGIILLKLSQKQIVWIAHNKQCHIRCSLASRWCMWLTAKCANRTITHASEGIRLFQKKYGIKHIEHIPHPAYFQELKPADAPTYDYIIWGSIDRRKQVLEFIKFARTRPFFIGKNILICGRPQDEAYRKQLQDACAGFCKLKDEFISDEQLDIFLRQSACILFTYKDENTLGSGALIYSLNYGKPIIGPRSGAFADMPGIVSCYDSFKDIEMISAESNGSRDIIESYLKANTWKAFADSLLMTFST